MEGCVRAGASLRFSSAMLMSLRACACVRRCWCRSVGVDQGRALGSSPLKATALLPVGGRHGGGTCSMQHAVLDMQQARCRCPNGQRLSATTTEATNTSTTQLRPPSVRRLTDGPSVCVLLCRSPAWVARCLTSCSTFGNAAPHGRPLRTTSLFCSPTVPQEPRLRLTHHSYRRRAITPVRALSSTPVASGFHTGTLQPAARSSMHPLLPVCLPVPLLNTSTCSSSLICRPHPPSHSSRLSVFSFHCLRIPFFPVRFYLVCSPRIHTAPRGTARYLQYVITAQ